MPDTQELAKLPAEPIAAPEPPREKKKRSNRLPAIISSIALVCVVAAIGLQRIASGRKRSAASAKKPAAQAAAKPAPAKPVGAKPAPADAPVVQTAAKPASAGKPAPAADAKPMKFSITAEIVPVSDMVGLRKRVGQEVAVRGRVAGARSRGEEVFVDFENMAAGAVSISFPVTKQAKADALKHIRGYKNQMVCVQGLVELRDDAIIVRGQDLRQLDVLPPL